MLRPFDQRLVRRACLCSSVYRIDKTGIIKLGCKVTDYARVFLSSAYHMNWMPGSSDKRWNYDRTRRNSSACMLIKNFPEPPPFYAHFVACRLEYGVIEDSDCRELFTINSGK